MARNALFPETILDATEADGMDGEESERSSGVDEELENLLASLSAWDDGKGESSTATSFSTFDSSSFGDVLTDELQAWRQQNVDSPYDKWSDAKKEEFMVRC